MLRALSKASCCLGEMQCVVLRKRKRKIARGVTTLVKKDEEGGAMSVRADRDLIFGRTLKNGAGGKT
jgi:hypothetical protein